MSSFLGKLVLNPGVARLSAFFSQKSHRFWTMVNPYYHLVSVLGYFGQMAQTRPHEEVDDYQGRG
ncbi:hypothetical protein [Microcoleus vaginatus]|uniref:hypothetical protein n=1 Tax=Microcoleus vaginatus TaxID=119532 RepID=UPI0002F2E6A5